MQINMKLYQIKLKMISEVSTLERMKRDLQRQVSDSRLNWQQRMVIYKKVELIVERLREVSTYRKPVSA